MISPDKQRQALFAINAVLIQCRMMAFEKEDHGHIARVLDIAEYLPMLMLEKRDTTLMFRKMLVDLAEKFAPFQMALERFDADETV